jgi:hypothetical protein
MAPICEAQINGLRLLSLDWPISKQLRANTVLGVQCVPCSGGGGYSTLHYPCRRPKVETNIEQTNEHVENHWIKPLKIVPHSTFLIIPGANGNPNGSASCRVSAKRLSPPAEAVHGGPQYRSSKQSAPFIQFYKPLNCARFAPLLLGRGLDQIHNWLKPQAFPARELNPSILH